MENPEFVMNFTRQLRNFHEMRRENFFSKIIFLSIKIQHAD